MATSNSTIPITILPPQSSPSPQTHTNNLVSTPATTSAKPSPHPTQNSFTCPPTMFRPTINDVPASILNSLQDFLMVEHLSPTAPANSKPFDRAAAEYIIKRFRGGLYLAFIMDELSENGYVVPCEEKVGALLAANGMAEKDEEVLGSRGFKAHEGRVWGPIVVPEGVLSRASPEGA
ncbi:hypothetical protein MMC27_006277 [Xylographa pallens]|nr:hypothetical protein [Xylographa pallens]